VRVFGHYLIGVALLGWCILTACLAVVESDAVGEVLLRVIDDQLVHDVAIVLCLEIEATCMAPSFRLDFLKNLLDYGPRAAIGTEGGHQALLIEVAEGTAMVLVVTRQLIDNFYT